MADAPFSDLPRGQKQGLLVARSPQETFQIVAFGGVTRGRLLNGLRNLLIAN